MDAGTEALVLRLVVLLRRRGMPHHEALALAAAGLPPGTARREVEGMVESLRRGALTEEGGAEPGETSPLGRRDAGEAELEAAALVADAAARVQSATANARIQLTLLAAAPAVIGVTASVIGLVENACRNVGEPDPGWFNAGSFVGLVGISITLGACLFAPAFARRLAPGAAAARTAAELYAVAADSRRPTPKLADVDGEFLFARARTAGMPAAARELGDELIRESGRTQVIAQAAVPLLLALAMLPVAVVVIGAMYGPIFEMAGHVE